MHKFHLRQTVEYHPRVGTRAPRGPDVVTAKLPERDGEFEYRIRSALEEHERMVRKSELQPMSEAGEKPSGKPKR
jgi:hypothetical protein